MFGRNILSGETKKKIKLILITMFNQFFEFLIVNKKKEQSLN